MKTSELTGAALDWVVAKCEGWTFEDDGYIHICRAEGRHTYSTNWAQGGPIIEREFITIVNAAGDDVWSAYPLADDPVAHRKSGPTPLIAAMRCYCCSKLGDEVEIPEELR